jgi:UDP-GlcNAc:undecaprenyl-phosphate/decaprenyl-phosphate GlcNAc-1-phosphate transferase
MKTSIPYLLALFFAPFAVSWLLTLLLIRWSSRLGLVDQPNERKVHTQPTPRGGGLAIYISLVLTALAFRSTVDRDFAVALTLGVGIVLLGLVDDLRPLPWQLRLGLQTLAAGAAVALLSGESPVVVKVLAVLWIASLVNAFNMLDNMDGLSAGVAWIAAAMFGLAAVVREQSLALDKALPLLMFMGSLSGFLWFNRSPARIFMGDAGSTFLGFYLGLASLQGIFSGEPLSAGWLAPVCILAVAWYDLTSVVVLRLWQGRSPFHADKQHLSHRLVGLGLSSRAAVCVIYLLALASGFAGLALLRVTTDGALFVGLQAGCMWLAVAALEYARHFRPTPATIKSSGHSSDLPSVSSANDFQVPPIPNPLLHPQPGQNEPIHPDLPGR